MSTLPSPETAPVDGWVQFRGQGAWSEATFSLSPPGQPTCLIVRTVGSSDVTEIELDRVTSLDEIIGAPEGYLRAELEVDRLPLVQGVWPESFTQLALDALAGTVAPAGRGRTIPTRSGEFVSDRPPKRRDRRRLQNGLIGALALIGIAAMIVGVFSLREATADPQSGADVTTTTIEGAAR